MNNKKKYVDVIPPQKGTIVDSEQGTNVEMLITREWVDLFFQTNKISHGQRKFPMVKKIVSYPGRIQFITGFNS